MRALGGTRLARARKGRSDSRCLCARRVRRRRAALQRAADGLRAASAFAGTGSFRRIGSSRDVPHAAAGPIACELPKNPRNVMPRRPKRGVLPRRRVKPNETPLQNRRSEILCWRLRFPRRHISRFFWQDCSFYPAKSPWRRREGVGVFGHFGCVGAARMSLSCATLTW